MGLTATPPSPTARLTAAGAPRAIHGLVVGLICAAVAATIAARWVDPTRGDPAVLQVLVVLAALVVAGSINLEYHFRGQTDAFDHFEVALVPALYYLPPVYVVVVVALAKLAAQLYRRVRPVRAAFNVAQWAAAAAVGALVYAVLRNGSDLDSDLVALAVATVAAVVVNKAAVALVLSLVQRRSSPQRPAGALTSLLFNTIGTGLVNMSFGLLFVATAESVPIATPLLLLPFGLLHFASRGYAEGRLEQMRLRMRRLAAFELGGTGDSDAAIATFLATVGRGLERDVVDLVVSTPGGVEVRRWRRDSDAVTVEQMSLSAAGPLTHALLSIEQPVRADTSKGDAALRQLVQAEGWRDCAAAPLPESGEEKAVLVLYGAREAVALPDLELAIIGELAREVGLARQRARLARAVLEERAKMAQIVTETGDGIATLGPDGTILSWNPALERISGYSAAELVGSAGMEVLQPVDAAGRDLPRTGWSAQADHTPTDVLIRTRTGERRWLSCSYAHGVAEAGAPERLIVMARDVTELKYAEARLAGHTAVLQLIASGEDIDLSLQVLALHLSRIDEGLSCAVLLVDRDDPGRLQLAAAYGIDADVLSELDAFSVGPLAGWTGRAVRRRSAVFVDDVETHGDSATLLRAARNHGVRSCSAVPIRADDSDRVIGVLALYGTRPRPHAAARDRDLLERAAHLAAIAVARSEYEARLAYQATHDALTGLPNRAVLLERCADALVDASDGSHAVMIFLDVDRFKLVNDSMGHEAGDQLLIEIGRRLRSVLRPGDTIARFGGDEFTMLCEHVPDEEFLFSLAERVQGVFAEPFALRGDEVTVTSSIGLAVGRPGTSPDELVGNADAAMYRAKERGGSRYEVYDSSMRAPSQLHLATHTALSRALDNGELILFYQPIVSLASGQWVGVEALLRWVHPDRGLLDPADFLQLAENTGLVVPIGEHIVTTACEQAHAWRHLGPYGGPLRMNINLSARELGQSDLPVTVGRRLAASGADPASICFEITESALLYDVTATAATLRHLKDLGVKLAIDDFGTGYSALTHLRRFPVDALKVDRSFVAGLDRRDDRAIVSAVVGLAHSLELSATAEGVETTAQLAALKELGCDEGQGFFYSEPRPAPELELAWPTSVQAG